MKKGLNSSLLGQTRISFNLSRHSYHSRINESRINNSFDLLENSLIDTSLQHPLLNHPTSRRSHIAERKQKNRKPERIKKNYLTRVLMNRMINVRLALKAMEDIPRVLFNKGPTHDIASALTLKSKITLETSVLRTLLYSSGTKQKPEQSKLKLQRGYNTFVTATPSNNHLQEQLAILTLNSLFKESIRACVKKFRLNYERKTSICRYFAKMCSNFELSQMIAFNAFKCLPAKAKKSGVDPQTIILNKLNSIAQQISSNALRLKTEAFSVIQMKAQAIKLGQEYGAKNMVLFSKLRREQAFQLWVKTTYDCRQREKKRVMVEEKKLQAVQKIVQRNYLKLLIEIIRRISTIQKVAVRLGCASKINQQKALWRLFVHYTKRSNK